MYESITYAEIKSLPKERKFDAWKELKTLYPKQKELAEKLGVSPSIVYNMIARYTKDEEAFKKEKTELTGKSKKRGNKAKKQERNDNQEQIIAVKENNLAITKNNSFVITIKKMVSGEDAQYFLNGIGGTLIKNQKYSVEIKISEK